jgi:hypothetical protein
MPRVKKSAVKKSSARKTSYLTKRRLLRAAQSGIQQAAIETMNVMGYTVVVNRGWVVKKFADGTIEKLERVAKKKIAIRVD